MEELDTNKAEYNPYSSAEINHLIAEEKLLRLLRPDVIATVRRALQQHDVQDDVIVNGDELYLSFLAIGDAAQRQHLYRLIQRHQMGERVNLDMLPGHLRRLLQPELTGMGRLLGALLLGASGGIIIGVLAMAISILLVNLLDLLIGSIRNEFAGMGITAVTFVVFSFLGWGASTMIAWRRLRNWNQLSEGAANIRRRFWR